MTMTIRPQGQRMTHFARLIGLLLLSVFLACQSDIEHEQSEKHVMEQQARDIAGRTAEESRGLFPEEFDFSRINCTVNDAPYYILLKVLGGPRDEIVNVIYEAMDVYGLAPLPENPNVPSDGRFVHSDDVRLCYLMWRGLGTDDMLFTSPPEWDFETVEAFFRVLLSRFSARGLSRFVEMQVIEGIIINGAGYLRERHEEFDFSRINCTVNEVEVGDNAPYYIPLKVLGGPRDEIVNVIYEAMDVYGLAPLPENPNVPSDGRFVHSDDVRLCYHIWQGLGTDDMLFTSPPEWDFETVEALFGVLLSRFSARGLSRFVEMRLLRE